MRKRYRPRNNKNYTVDKFYYSGVEIDFTKDDLNYEYFLLQEFFNANNDTISKVSNYYSNAFGEKALEYLDRKFGEWSKGDYHLTNMMKGRIVDMMPKFLNQNAKHKLGIHEFMNCIKNTVKSNQLRSAYLQRRLNDVDALSGIIEKEYEKINGIKVVYQNSFNILTTKELQEAEGISKYILFTKIESLVSQIELDFNNFLPYTNKFEKGKIDRIYSIPLLSVDFDLSTMRTVNVELPMIDSYYRETNNQFKSYSDRYLAYELTEVRKASNISTVNSFFNLSDLKILVDRYLVLLNSKSNAKISSKFICQAGTLTILIDIKPSIVIIISILMSLGKLIISTLVYFFLFQWAFSSSRGVYFFILLIATGVEYLFGKYEFEKLKSLNKELQSYG